MITTEIVSTKIFLIIIFKQTKMNRKKQTQTKKKTGQQKMADSSQQKDPSKNISTAPMDDNV